MLVTIGIIFVLLLLSAFFSGSETALTAASRPLMHDLSSQGNKRASVVAHLQTHREQLIGGILLGNNLVNILASALATSVLISLFGETGVVYATAGMTILVLIFAEILPKTYAIRNANRMALAVSPVLKVVVTVLSPITHVLQVVVRQALRMLSQRGGADEGMQMALAELRGAIELHANESAGGEHAMLRSILDLADVEVEEIMAHRRTLVMIDADLAPRDILDQVLKSPYTRIPFWQSDPDNIIGVVHAKGLLREVQRLGGDVDSLDIGSVIQPPWFIPESTTLLRQLQAFRERREHFALVVDEYGSLLGVVTLEDILEEIVGDITDEHDIGGTQLRKEPGGSYVVHGTVTLRDLNRELGWDLPDDEASTIAGLMIHESRAIPKVGQRFRFHDFTFEILRRSRNQIVSLRITPPPEGRDISQTPDDPE